MIRKATLAGALALGILSTSCLGPNNAQNSLRNWNAEVSDQDWVCEIVFLGLNVIPVYGIASIADVLVLNTIDYWSGDNPIDEPGPFPSGFGKAGGGE